jgi:hypothetical protein
MHRCLPPRFVCRYVFPAFALLVTALVGAQPPGEKDPLASVSMSDLETEASRSRKKSDELFKGTTPLDPKDELQDKAIDAQVRHVLYRFHDVKANEPGFADRVFQDFEDLQLKPILTNKEKNTGVPQLFTTKMIAHAKLVLHTPRPKYNVAAINAARVLAKLTKLGQPELADALVDILKEEVDYDAKPGDLRRNDGVKLYVLRGLGEMLAFQEQNPPVLRKGQDVKIIEALTAFIERKPPLEKNAAAEEVEGYRALRREAVRALANGRVMPQQSALVLLRVMARDGFTPEPRLDERVDAAVGVLRLNIEANKDYQPDYAAYQVGLFVDALGTSIPKAKEEQRPLKAWAARLIDGFDALKAGATKAKNDTAVKVADQCVKLLQPMEDKGTLNPAAVVELDNWLSANPPKSDSLFKGVKEATVKPANRPEDEAPEK